MSLPVSLIFVPYYLGHRDHGMGAGPSAFREAGIADRLKAAGCDVFVRSVDYGGSIDHEIGASFAVNRLLAAEVRAAVGDGHFPLVMAGNCGSCVGTLAGLSDDALGVVWLDAHGDFHTPDTTGSGFFDGLPLTLATGQCYQRMLSTIDGFEPIPEQRVLLAGVRELDPGERERVQESNLITCDFETLSSEGITSSFVPRLELLGSRAESIYLHVDLDVLHNRLVPASEYSPAGGLAPSQLSEMLGLIAGRFNVLAASLNCYNPAGDPEGKALQAGLDVIHELSAQS